MKATFNAVLIPIAVILTSIFMLSACNTVEGLGKDMQAGGKELQKAATDEHSH
ncbi:entericidin A/B family lipoprotein [Aquicella lusitana]|uniref:Putative small secreted protein n=1 Tax=Aquicella lusitana TaxID=254246 RepID=A0A370GMQ0_9COXI|nr:entericidin A/B family lipoprotein [Aquicella lusitana]RDI44556.1 putative small secreted protein [Aquicella lusitana]VVC72502.1 hypothetical protein AQULUS_02140 [Aquicella lusitana]